MGFDRQMRWTQQICLFKSCRSTTRPTFWVQFVSFSSGNDFVIIYDLFFIVEFSQALTFSSQAHLVSNDSVHQYSLSSNDTLTITVHNKIVLFHTQFLEKFLHLQGFFTAFSDCNIFYFSGRQSDTLLMSDLA